MEKSTINLPETLLQDISQKLWDTIEEVISLGLSQRHEVYKLKGQKTIYILKLCHRNKPENHLKNEFEALWKDLEGIGPIWFLHNIIWDTEYIVQEYISGDSMNRENISYKDILILGKTIKWFHDTTNSEDIYGVNDNVRSYIQESYDVYSQSFPDIHEQIIHIYKYLLSQQQNKLLQSEKVVFIHGDINPENIVKTSGWIKLLDWECGRYDFREMDIVSCIFYFELSAKQILFLLKSYGYPTDAFSINKLTVFYVYCVFYALSARIKNSCELVDVLSHIEHIYSLVKWDSSLLGERCTPTQKDYHALVHEKKEYSNIVLIDWSLGSTCNYRCSYCPDSLHNGKTPWIPKKIILSIWEKIITHYKSIWKKCCFQFTWWEPTLHPDFKEIIIALKDAWSYIGIISNGSRTQKFWSEIVPYIDNVNITYHGEFAKPGTFIDLIKYIGGQTRVNINVTMDPKEFDIRKNIVEQLTRLSESIDISVTAKPLFIDFWSELYYYSSEQLKFLNNAKQITEKSYKNQVRWEMKRIYRDHEEIVKPANIISEGDNSWYGWNCNIGIESLVINMAGDVYRWHCKVGWKIWNIYLSQDLEFTVNWVVCSKKKCNCAADIFTTKTI